MTLTPEELHEAKEHLRNKGGKYAASWGSDELREYTLALSVVFAALDAARTPGKENDRGI